MDHKNQLDRRFYNIIREDLNNIDSNSICSDEIFSDFVEADSVKNKLQKKSNNLNVLSNKWDYRVYKKEKLQYIDEDDLISSDETVSDLDSIDKNVKNKSTKKFNQLNPTAKHIQRLLKSSKPKTKSLWMNVEVSLSSIDSDNRNSTYSIIYKDSSQSMENSSSKRKRKEHSLDEEELLHDVRKKIKRTNSDTKKSHVNRKEQAHSFSSSDSECNNTSPSRSLSSETSLKGIDHNKNKLNHLLTSDEDQSGSNVSTSSKKLKLHKDSAHLKHVRNESNHLLTSDEGSNSSPKKLDNVIRVKKEFNNQLSSSEGNNNCENKNPPTFKVPHNSGKQFVKMKTEVIEPSDEDSQTMETDHWSNKDSGSSDDTRKSQNNRIQAQDKPKRIQIFSEDDKKELSKYSLFLDEDLAEKNNIWILQCPSNLDCAELMGQSLDLTGKGSASLTVGSTVYEAYSYRDHASRSATLAVPDSSNQLHVCKIPVIGNIIIEETVNTINKKSFSIPDAPEKVEMPQNLKIRHPLLGHDYELKASISSFHKSHKVPKKKKRSKSFDESVSSNGLIEEDLETLYGERDVKKKKHKKKKKYVDEESN